MLKMLKNLPSTGTKFLSEKFKKYLFGVSSRFKNLFFLVMLIGLARLAAGRPGQPMENLQILR
jgi:hypothetical protein